MIYRYYILMCFIYMYLLVVEVEIKDKKYIGKS